MNNQKISAGYNQPYSNNNFKQRASQPNALYPLSSTDPNKIDSQVQIHYIYNNRIPKQVTRFKKMQNHCSLNNYQPPVNNQPDQSKNQLDNQQQPMYKNQILPSNDQPQQNYYQGSSYVPAIYPQSNYQSNSNTQPYYSRNQFQMPSSNNINQKQDNIGLGNYVRKQIFFLNNQPNSNSYFANQQAQNIPSQTGSAAIHQMIQPSHTNYSNTIVDNAIGINEGDLRINFIRKVYSILSAQMTLTVFMCYLSMTNEAYSTYQKTHMFLTIIAILANLITLFSIVCFQQNARTVPLNYILLFIFTLSEAYIVSTACILYNQMVVFQAASITLLITISLTIYACTTKSDFTILGGQLFIFSSILLFAGLFYCHTNLLGFFLFFCHSQVLSVIYCAIWAIIYGIYIIYDTQLIIGRKQLELSYDDYIFGALMIYVDIIGLFLQILELLGEAQQSSN